MKIAIIGTGNVGGTLGRRWAQAGHEVVFCTRSPESDKVQELVSAAGASTRAATTREGVAASEVVVLATPWPATLEAIAGAGDLSGKIVVDATNPLKPDLSGLAVPADTSAGEQVAAKAKGAHVVKAFNTIPFSTMQDPRFGAEKADLLICGDDAEAKRTVATLAEALGFVPIDVGPLPIARHIEHLALLWIYLAFKGGWGPNFTFKITKR